VGGGNADRNLMRARFLFGLFLLALSPGVASAHLMSAQKASVNVVGRSAFVVVATPASALSGVDGNGDGKLSALEIGRGSPAIATQFRSGFHLTDAGGPGVIVFTWVMAPSQDVGPTSADGYVVVLQRVDFPAPPSDLAVRTSLFGSAAGERQITLQATRGPKADVVVLSARSPASRLFRSTLQTFAAYAPVGFEHIGLGFDHLLFLLAIVVAATGWRSLFALSVTFTLAHSITLALAIFGWIRIPPTIIEPAIALSIVFMAADNLLRGAGIGRERLALVAGFGLLHSLGFASALDGFGSATSQRLAGLAGFNLGVEAGQLAFLLALVGLGALGRRRLAGRWDQIWPRAASASAGLAGLTLLATRLV